MTAQPQALRAAQLRAQLAQLRAERYAPELLAALRAIAQRIDAASGSPRFTAREHTELDNLIRKATGESHD